MGKDPISTLEMEETKPDTQTWLFGRRLSDCGEKSDRLPADAFGDSKLIRVKYSHPIVLDLKWKHVFHYRVRATGRLSEAWPCLAHAVTSACVFRINLHSSGWSSSFVRRSGRHRTGGICCRNNYPHAMVLAQPRMSSERQLGWANGNLTKARDLEVAGSIPDHAVLHLPWESNLP
ncbi:hypothetical protein ElyMa_005594000 [Elysia marginata]|uniref:Uncharacterized protein n=1 Tax=Elysia marginata TaxID=1093978 RepID=A0AAV4F5B5_9GAST|nr:hypothetical protein ElyMa_005594000 [Elysia marginata]